MYSLLIVDRSDPKWLLSEQVLIITTSRRTKQELYTRAFIEGELRKRAGLRNLGCMTDVPS